MGSSFTIQATRKKPMQIVLKDFRDHFETERLIVRAPRSGDGLAVHAARIETHTQLRDWPVVMPWAQTEPLLEESEAYCRRGQAAFLARTDLPMLAFLKADQTFAGCISLQRMDWEVPRFEIGYWLRTSQQKKGLALEAVNGITLFALQELCALRVEIHCSAANHASRNVAERAGFTLEGILHNHKRLVNGRIVDSCIYARLA